MLAAMIQQLPTPIEVETPLGPGFILFTWEWTSHCWYGVCQNETGEMWWWDNHLVRIAQNISEGRCQTSPITLNAATKKALAPHLKRYKVSTKKHKPRSSGRT